MEIKYLLNKIKFIFTLQTHKYTSKVILFAGVCDFSCLFIFAHTKKNSLKIFRLNFKYIIDSSRRDRMRMEVFDRCLFRLMFMVIFVVSFLTFFVYLMAEQY